MIWPAEADTALTALRTARDRVQDAVDELGRLRASAGAVALFEQANSALSWSIEHVSDALIHGCRAAVDAEAVEERHVDCQLFPWVEEDR